MVESWSEQSMAELQWFSNEMGHIYKYDFAKMVQERQVLGLLADEHGFNFILFAVLISSPILLFYVWNIYNWGT